MDTNRKGSAQGQETTGRGSWRGQAALLLYLQAWLGGPRGVRVCPAAGTKYHPLTAWLTQAADTDFSQFWRLRAKGLADLVLGKGSLPGLSMAAFHGVLTQQSERANSRPLPLLIRATVP